MDAQQQTNGRGGAPSHPDECMSEKCCQGKGTTSRASIAREFDDDDDDDVGGNTLDVTDMAMMGVVLMANGDGGGNGRDPREEEAPAASSSDNAAMTTTQQKQTHTAQPHPADCLCEACRRAQTAAGITEDHADDCECEECCRKLMMTTQSAAASHAQTTTNQPNDGTGNGIGRVPAPHHRECLCEFCCRKLVLESIAAQDERDRREWGHMEDDQDAEEDEEDEDDVYYDYEYDYDDYQMYGWVGTDANAVGGGAVERPNKGPGTANHASKKKPRKQASASASSRSGAKRRRTTNPALAMSTRTSTPPLLSTNDNPAESLRRALLVNDDLGIMQNRGVLQAIIDAISSELLDGGFPSSRDKARMTDIAQLARQVRDATNDGAPSGHLAVANAKKKKKPGAVAYRKKTPSVSSAGNEKKRKKSTTIPRTASADLSNGGVVGSTSHWRGKVCPSNGANEEGTGNNKRKRPKHGASAGSAALSLQQSAAVTPTIAAATTKNRFDQRLEELKQFKEKHGHFKVPTSNMNLYMWLHAKKAAYAEGGAYRTYRISPEEAEALRDIGVDMDGNNAKTRVLFRQRLEELKQFKEKHGHFKVPTSNMNLYMWLHAKKAAYAEGGAYRTCRISPEEAEALRDIGVDMDGNNVKTRVLFRQRLEELKQFKEKHGHFKVPTSNRNLYMWLRSKKKAYAEGGAWRTCRISPEEAEALRDIGVDMDGNDKKSSAEGTRNTKRKRPKHRASAGSVAGVDMDGNDEKTSVLFRQKLEELKQFKEKHGHFKVPKRSNSKLYAWLYVKKRAYADGGGYRDYRITPEEAEALRDIGVDMDCTARTKRREKEEVVEEEVEEEEEGDANPGGAGSAVWASGRSRFADRRRRAGRGSSRDRSTVAAAVAAEAEERQDEDPGDGNGGETINVDAGDDSGATCLSMSI